ncbi:DUF4304 domain-containing protein [Veillonella nakazawae]|uniref:DUF4304 domain-containing protein n=1 Tax=Veillonella nakazawae TaxID=2682456 RepID=UPI00399524FA
MKPRELCEKAWQEIASKFPDFKVVSKGQKLKKLSQNKDLTFEIYFQANRNNYACSVEFVPHVFIYSKDMKKANYHNGFVYGGELGSLLNRKAWHWWQLAGASYQYTVDEVSKLCEEYIIPLFAGFEDTERNIEKLIEGDINDYNLPYYIYHYGGKDKAQQYFNKIIKNSELRSMYIDFYNQLKDMPKENISLDKSEFYGSAMIKFAYLHGIEIEK